MEQNHRPRCLSTRKTSRAVCGRPCCGGHRNSHFFSSPAGVKPAFEVASIKPGDPGQRGSWIINRPGESGLLTRGMPLRALITFAYRVRDFQSFGGPAWLTTIAGISRPAPKRAVLPRRVRRIRYTPPRWRSGLPSLLKPGSSLAVLRIPSAHLRTLGRQRRIQGKAVGGSSAVSTSEPGTPAPPAATWRSHATLQYESRPGQSRSRVDGYIQRRATLGVPYWDESSGR